jgi:hypothetical protein
MSQNFNFFFFCSREPMKHGYSLNQLYPYRTSVGYTSVGFGYWHDIDIYDYNNYIIF